MTDDPTTTATTVFTIDIRATRQQVWDALTETGTPRGWLYGTVTLRDLTGHTAIAAERDTPSIYSSLKSQLETCRSHVNT